MGCYFSGWYFRCQSPSQALAVIPAFHKSPEGRSCSIQVITDGASWNIPFPYAAFRQRDNLMEIGENRFGSRGITLALRSPGFTAEGSLRFDSLSPICYNIMGPFRFVPFMECRHSVLSMRHWVTGELRINGMPYEFDGAFGYWEGDRGRSFPREYAWTQCCFPEGSLMLSAADIPFAGCHFTGVIGVILWHGKEYRLATYLGAKATKILDGEIIIQQGSKRLTAKLLEKTPHPLQAPLSGVMERTIHEHVSCKAFYRFEENGHTVFETEVPNAAFEYEYST